MALTHDELMGMYNKWYANLCAYATSLINNTEESHDIVTDCFIKVWKKYESGKLFSEGDGKGILLTSVKYACIDYLRKQKRTRKLFQLQFSIGRENEERQKWETIENRHSIEERVITLIYENLENLLTTQRKRIFKLYLNGMSTPEIAEKFGLSQQTVLNQKANAVNDLRKAVRQFKNLAEKGKEISFSFEKIGRGSFRKSLPRKINNTNVIEMEPVENSILVNNLRSNLTVVSSNLRKANKELEEAKEEHNNLQQTLEKAKVEIEEYRSLFMEYQKFFEGIFPSKFKQIKETLTKYA